MEALTLCINVRLQLIRLASTVPVGSNLSFEEELDRLSKLVLELEDALEKQAEREPCPICKVLCSECTCLTNGKR
jgi:hypothetical protein